MLGVFLFRDLDAPDELDAERIERLRTELESGLGKARYRPIETYGISFVMDSALQTRNSVMDSVLQTRNSPTY
jgi:hypothetical protein